MLFTYFNRHFYFTSLFNIFYFRIFFKLIVFIFERLFRLDVFPLYDNMILCGIVDFIVNLHVQSNCIVSI